VWNWNCSQQEDVLWEQVILRKFVNFGEFVWKLWFGSYFLLRSLCVSLCFSCFLGCVLYECVCFPHHRQSSDHQCTRTVLLEEVICLPKWHWLPALARVTEKSYRMTMLQ
jgi:hypothetical protein